MENFLIRENTTKLSDVHFDLSGEAGFTLETGLIDAIKECSDNEIKLYEAMTKVDSIMEEYRQLDMGEATITAVYEASFEQVKTVIVKAIKWLVSKITALWEMLVKFLGKVIDNTMELFSAPFEFISGNANDPQIIWFKDGINGQFKKSMDECGAIVRQKIVGGLGSILGNINDKLDSYASNPNEFLDEIGLTEVNNMIDTILKDTLVKCRASENVDFRSNVRAIAAGETLNGIIKSLKTIGMTFSVGSDNYQDAISQGLMRIRSDVMQQPYTTEELNKVNKVISAFCDCMLKTTEKVKTTLQNVGKLYMENGQKCARVFRNINKVMDDKARERREAEIAARHESADLIDESTVEELCELKFTNALRESHIDDHGKVVIIF